MSRCIYRLVRAFKLLQLRLWTTKHYSSSTPLPLLSLSDSQKYLTINENEFWEFVWYQHHTEAQCGLLLLLLLLRLTSSSLSQSGRLSSCRSPHTTDKQHKHTADTGTLSAAPAPAAVLTTAGAAAAAAVNTPPNKTRLSSLSRV